MMRRACSMLTILAISLISCTEPQHEVATLPTNDEQVIRVVLHDFADWKEVTFGELEGVLALDSLSTDISRSSVADIRSLAEHISNHLSDDLVESFMKRNRSPVSVAALVANSPWARIYQPPPEHQFFEIPPPGSKAIGSLTLPGYSSDGSRALMQIQHSWSIHSADVTYVLEKRDGTWRVLAKDQAVWL